MQSEGNNCMSIKSWNYDSGQVIWDGESNNLGFVEEILDIDESKLALVFPHKPEGYPYILFSSS